jgi:hypothetical protein
MAGRSESDRRRQIASELRIARGPSPVRSYWSKGSRWDPKKMREARESGWFKQNETAMIQDLRRRRIQEARRRKVLVLKPVRECPDCGGTVTMRNLEGIDIGNCVSCGGLFFDEGELDELLRGEERRPGLLRRLP